MQALKSMINKFAKNQKKDEEWIEIKCSLDELDNIKLAEAVKSSL